MVVKPLLQYLQRVLIQNKDSSPCKNKKHSYTWDQSLPTIKKAFY
jgi:hypothetical protein